MDRILKLFVDLIYRTNSKKNKFESKENEKVLASDASKGIITKQNDDIKRGANWIISQRAVILLTDKRIVCGKWVIPIEKITKASLIRVKTIFGGGQVLKIETNDNESFQFGMQKNDDWINQNALKLIVENGEIKTSTFSWIIRIAAVGYLAYLLLQKVGVFPY